MNRRDLLLAIMAASDGQAFTPVQIQKASFLITENMPHIVTDGPAFQFSPYDYGPFDLEVYRAADALQEQGLAEIGVASNGRWRTYAATNEGVAAGRQFLDSMTPEQRDYVARVAQWVRGLSFAALVKSIYEAYPRMRENSIFQG